MIVYTLLLQHLSLGAGPCIDGKEEYKQSKQIRCGKQEAEHKWGSQEINHISWVNGFRAYFKEGQFCLFHRVESF